MKALNKLLVLLTVFFGLSYLPAQAADIKVNWITPEKYTDVRPGNWGTKAKYIESVTKRLTKHFEVLAAKQPQGWNFQFDVTNLDLAGDVLIGGMNQYRVIKSPYIPRISFAYLVTDEAGKILYKGQEQLKDLDFDVGVNRYHDEALRYEYQMLDNWFNETFPLD